MSTHKHDEEKSQGGSKYGEDAELHHPKPQSGHSTLDQAQGQHDAGQAGNQPTPPPAHQVGSDPPEAKDAPQAPDAPQGQPTPPKDAHTS